MITEEITKKLFEMQDLKYRELLIRTIPGMKEEMIIGVRTPRLRSYAKELSKREESREFLKSVPHTYFDENQLHAFLLSLTGDYDACIKGVNEFLPFVDNWATCDQMNPGVFRKRKVDLLKEIKRWLKSTHTYTVRFGIKMLMDHFLDEDYDVGYPKMVASVRSDEYYVNMMIAWYFATALAKQYESILPFIEEHHLAPWTNNKAIRKAVESYRVTEERKKYLKTLKIK